MVSELKVIIISKDNKLSTNLTGLLEQGGVKAIHQTHKINGLGKFIEAFKPDILFIRPDGLSKSPARIAEITAEHDHFVKLVLIENASTVDMKGLPFGAVSYLSETFSFQEVDQLISSLLYDRRTERHGDLLERLNSKVCPAKLKFSTRSGHTFIDPEEIIYLKADSNYTHVHLRDRRHITVSKSLRTFDIGLTNSFFVRISRSAIININYLVELDRNQKSCLLKYNGQEFKLPITKNHTKVLMKHYLNC
jgi:DNA-binding LytR/AlgR family response regulator